MEYTQDTMGMLSCPNCRTIGLLEVDFDRMNCKNYQQTYPIVNNIPLMFWPEARRTSEGNVTNYVKAFYEENPFPNYDDFDSVGSLMQKARTSVFAKMLDEQLPFGIKVLAFERFLVELLMIFTNTKEGGFFIVIGKKER